MPARPTFRRSCWIARAEASKSSGITGPPCRPSSVTSVQRTTGVHNDLSHARSVPGMKNSASLTFCKVARYFASKMSPRVFSTTTRTALLMPARSLRFSR